MSEGVVDILNNQFVFYSSHLAVVDRVIMFQVCIDKINVLDEIHEFFMFYKGSCFNSGMNPFFLSRFENGLGKFKLGENLSAR